MTVSSRHECLELNIFEYLNNLRVSSSCKALVEVSFRISTIATREVTQVWSESDV